MINEIRPVIKGAMDERCKKWKKRKEEAFTDHAQWCIKWQDISEIFYPERADFTEKHTPGDERYDGIFTSVPQLMRRDMASKLGSVIRPRGKDWAKMVARPEELMEYDSVRKWCERATQTQRNLLYWPKAGFTSAAAEADNDYVAFGSSVVRHTENISRSGLLFTCCHLANTAWTVNSENVVDELYEKCPDMALKDLAKIFGVENLPDEWRKELEDHPLRKKRFTRCVAPIEEYDYDKAERPMRGARYMSLYMADGLDRDDAALGEGYFKVFPYWVRRWMTVSGEAYGRSPCVDVALADARSLNVAEEATLRAIEWQVDPPKYARHDAIVGELRLEAGAVTYIDDEYDERYGQPIKNIESGEPRYGMEFAREKYAMMGAAFFENILKLPSGEMTAFEVAERLEILTTEAAPIFEPMEAENALLMDMVFERGMDRGAFGHLMEDGSIEGLPEELEGADIEFEFDTPLTTALRKLKASQGDALMARAQQIVTIPGAENATDNVDWDAAFRDMLDGTAPEKWKRDKDGVMAIRDQRAQAQQAAEAEAAAMELAKVGANANPENLNAFNASIEEGQV